MGKKGSKLQRFEVKNEMFKREKGGRKYIRLFVCVKSVVLQYLLWLLLVLKGLLVSHCGDSVGVEVLS